MNIYITNHAEVVEDVQYWMRTLHFCLYLGQFSTDFTNSFFPLKAYENCNLAHTAIAQTNAI